jgi:hypothetical protein
MIKLSLKRNLPLAIKLPDFAQIDKQVQSTHFPTALRLHLAGSVGELIFPT